MSKKFRHWFHEIRNNTQGIARRKPSESEEDVDLQNLTRRDFMKGGVLLGAGLAASSYALPARGATAPRIVIVGAGLAGMTAAYRIWKRTGYRPMVFEADNNIGGRTSTIHNLPGGQWAERGGQSVSTNEKHIRALLQELGIPLIDTDLYWPDGEVVFQFGGVDYTEDQISRGLNQVYTAAESQFEEVVYVASYKKKNERTIYFDNLSVAQWINLYCPGGLGSPLGQALKVNFENDYAGRIEDASSLIMIYDLAGPGGEGYDERYVIKDGSDRPVNKMAELLPAGSIQTGKALIALHQNVDGSVRCTFQSGSAVSDVTADFLVLALPFTILREVDYAEMGFSTLKQTAIREMGMGLNAKVHFQFTRPYWANGQDGESMSDLTTGVTWPANIGLPGSESLLAIMNGSNFAMQYVNTPAHGPAPQWVIDSHLAAVEQLFPGAGRYFNGVAYLDAWSFCPYHKGSYSCYLRGQFTKFGGIEAKLQGRVFFAGEHTAKYELRGTMNGAVQSGERSASQLLNRL